jgi:hypothetical protein
MAPRKDEAMSNCEHDKCVRDGCKECCYCGALLRWQGGDFGGGSGKIEDEYQALKLHYDNLRNQLAKNEALVKMMAEALEFYAVISESFACEKRKMIIDPLGHVAREALEAYRKAIE